MPKRQRSARRESSPAHGRDGRADPIAGLIEAAETMLSSGQTGEAVALYRAWISQHAVADAYVAYFNLGVILSGLGELASAEASYRCACEGRPDFIEAFLNLGSVLERQGREAEAIAQWRHVLTLIKPHSVPDAGLCLHALNNLGRLLEIRKDYSGAEHALEQSLSINPRQPEVIAHWVHLRQRQCAWPAFKPFGGVSMDDLTGAASALALLAGSADPQMQLAAARRYVQKKVLSLQTPLAPEAGYAHERLRIGYLSSDFCGHAVSILTAELYGLHDRNRIEVFGFCWSREDGSHLRARVTGGMDHHIRIGEMSDRQAAECIRAHEIDILVDLHGLTLNARHDILSYRPAPVQVTYLGFPGTTALPAIDYVIADAFVLPAELTPFFTEKPLYLPNSFQINDRQRAIGPQPSRAACKLPEQAFVFCSFNSTFKITPEMFGAWMQILRRVPGSILWLVYDHASVPANLRREAALQGIDPDRLVFAERVATEEYLARYQVADLFLDTYPFNAGTTASDALWAGLPVLTCAGPVFASRMAGSLLQSVNLPELITYTFEDYIETAVALAGDRPRLSAIKQHLKDTRLSCDLFDSAKLVAGLEKEFFHIAKRPTGQTMNDATSDQPDMPERAVAAEPAMTMKQTPINAVHNADVLHFMRPDYRRVIEVGSSSGVLAQAYREMNPAVRYTGIEIDRDYAEASKAHCTDVIFGNAEHIDDAGFREFSDGDCWVFADALEHLYDPWKMLERIRTVSSGPVEVVACIPNAQNWQLQGVLNGGNFRYQDSGLLDRTHIRWFTRATIIELFENAGFRVVGMTARILRAPGPEVVAAVRAMASVCGNDPDAAEQDCVAFQYVVKAVAA